MDAPIITIDQILPQTSENLVKTGKTPEKSSNNKFQTELEQQLQHIENTSDNTTPEQETVENTTQNTSADTSDQTNTELQSDQTKLQNQLIQNTQQNQANQAGTEVNSTQIQNQNTQNQDTADTTTPTEQNTPLTTSTEIGKTPAVDTTIVQQNPETPNTQAEITQPSEGNQNTEQNIDILTQPKNTTEQQQSPINTQSQQLQPQFSQTAELDKTIDTQVTTTPTDAKPLANPTDQQAPNQLIDQMETPKINEAQTKDIAAETNAVPEEIKKPDYNNDFASLLKQGQDQNQQTTNTETSGLTQKQTETQTTNDITKEPVINADNAEIATSSTTTGTEKITPPKAAPSKSFSITAEQMNADQTKPLTEQAPVTQPKATQNIDTANIAEQVRENIETSVNNGQNQITIKLNPPELGRVDIQLVEKNGEITGLMKIESIETKYAVQQQMPQILRNLEQAGINIKKMDIDLSNGSDQQNANTQSSDNLFANLHQNTYSQNQYNEFEPEASFEEPDITFSPQNQYGTITNRSVNMLV